MHRDSQGPAFTTEEIYLKAQRYVFPLSFPVPFLYLKGMAGPLPPLSSPLSLLTEVVKHPPAVYLLPPAREQLILRESATVTCLVKGFSPADIFVQWLQRGQPLSSDKYVTSAPMPEPQAPDRYFTHSILTVTEEEWNSGETYTCVVGHEALPHMVTERTVDKSTGKPTLYNVSLIMSDTGSTCY